MEENTYPCPICGKELEKKHSKDGKKWGIYCVDCNVGFERDAKNPRKCRYYTLVPEVCIHCGMNISDLAYVEARTLKDLKKINVKYSVCMFCQPKVQAEANI